MVKGLVVFLSCCVILLIPFVSHNKSEYLIQTAGDVSSCEEDGDEQTSQLLSVMSDAIIPLGDLVYQEGTIEQFTECWHPTWGQFYTQIYPVIGNHSWRTPNAAGYFQYFPHFTNYYKFHLGEWLIIVLDSNCKRIGGCGIETEQYKWLEKTLQESDSNCIIAAWHHPLFSSTEYDDSTYEFYKLLYENKADVVLTGHHHRAEFFKKQDHLGNRQSDGIRQFIVGTGGKELHRVGRSASNVFYFNRHHFGVLNMTLKEDSYEWQFQTVDGKIRNSGRDSCNLWKLE